MTKVSIDTRNEGDVSFVSIAGELTEEVDFARVSERIMGTRVSIDLAGITRINSCGVREWIGFIRELELHAKQVILSRCPPLIVYQLNQIENFAGASGIVESILAPYCCPSCDTEHLQLMELLKGPVDLTKPVHCPRCQVVMELDAYAESYLGFTGDLQWKSES